MKKANYGFTVEGQVQKLIGVMIKLRRKVGKPISRAKAEQVVRRILNTPKPKPN